MKEIIRKIREHMKISQQELAEYMNVSFATINRWENNHAVPARSAQNRLFEYCIKNEIPLIDFIHEKIEAAALEISLPADRILLYHGSKSGLEGELLQSAENTAILERGFIWEHSRTSR